MSHIERKLLFNYIYLLTIYASDLTIQSPKSFQRVSRYEKKLEPSPCLTL